MNPPARFKFTLVTGRDFGRSIAWARTQPRLRDLALETLKSAKAEIQKGLSCSGLLTGQDKSEDLAAPASSGAGQPRQILGL